MEKYPIIGLLYIGLCSYTDLLIPPPPATLRHTQMFTSSQC